MNKYLFLLIFALCYVGNVGAVSTIQDFAKVELPGTLHDTFTGKYYIGKDKVSYKVYQGSRGGYYINRIAKNTGKAYKMYLTKEQFAKL